MTEKKLTTAHASNHLGAQLLKVLMDEITRPREPWAKISEAEQTQTIERMKNAVHQQVDIAVRMIAAGGCAAFPAELESMNVKDGIKLSLVVAKGVPRRDELMDHVGSTVMVVAMDSAQYLEGMDKIKAQADQPELPLEVEDLTKTYTPGELQQAIRGPAEPPPADALAEAQAALADLPPDPIETARAVPESAQLIPNDL